MKNLKILNNIRIQKILKMLSNNLDLFLRPKN